MNNLNKKSNAIDKKPAKNINNINKNFKIAPIKTESLKQGFFNIDLSRISKEEKRKALIMYKIIKKSAYPVTALSLIAIFQYSSTINLPTISLSNNNINISFSVPSKSMIGTNYEKSLSSLAADENIMNNGGSDSKNSIGDITNVDTVGKIGSFSLKEDLKSYFKNAGPNGVGFFSIPKGENNIVIFPKIKDGKGKDFTEEDIKVFVITNGVSKPSLVVASFPSIISEFIKNVNGIDEVERNDLMTNFIRSIYQPKGGSKVKISKASFGKDFNYYEKFLNEIVKLYPNKIEISK